MKGENARYERKDSYTAKDLDTAQIEHRKDHFLNDKRNAYKLQASQKGNEGEVSDERTANGRNGERSLEGSKPEGLQENGEGRSPGVGERSGGQTNSQRNADLDERENDRSGSLAGEQTPIHLPDERETSGELQPRLEVEN